MRNAAGNRVQPSVAVNWLYTASSGDVFVQGHQQRMLS
jgi:hypothetical protein